MDIITGSMVRRNSIFMAGNWYDAGKCSNGPGFSADSVWCCILSAIVIFVTIFWIFYIWLWTPGLKKEEYMNETVYFKYAGLD